VKKILRKKQESQGIRRNPGRNEKQSPRNGHSWNRKMQPGIIVTSCAHMCGDVLRMCSNPSSKMDRSFRSGIVGLGWDSFWVIRMSTLLLLPTLGIWRCIRWLVWVGFQLRAQWRGRWCHFHLWGPIQDKPWCLRHWQIWCPRQSSIQASSFGRGLVWCRRSWVEQDRAPSTA